MNTPIKAVVAYLKNRRRVYAGARFTRHLLTVCFYSSLSIVTLSVLFRFFPYTVFPLLLATVVLGTATGILLLFLRVFIFKKKTLAATAQKIDTELRPTISHPLLAIALDLSLQSSAHSNPDLCNDVYKRASQQVLLHKNSPRKRTLSRLQLLKGLSLAISSAVLFVVPPTLFSYWRLPLSFLSRTTVSIEPGTVRVAQKSSVTLSMKTSTSSVPSSRLTLFYPETRQTENRLLRPDSSGNFSFTIDSITQSVIYRYSYGTKRCPPETVSVVPPPYLSALSITLSPPAYTGQSADTLPPGQGDFSAYEGSTAHLSITAPRLVAASIIRFTDTITMELADSCAYATLCIDSSFNYHFSLTDSLQQRSDSIGHFSAQVLPDELPQVRFLVPGKNSTLEPAQVETLHVEATDDIGIKAATLYWRLGNGRDPALSHTDLSPKKGTLIWQTQFIWKINTLSLYPGDTLFYWAAVRDGHPDRRKHTVCSDTFWFRVPTFREMHKSMAEREEHAHDLISSVAEKQGELEDRVKQLDKATSRATEKTWEQQELAKEIRKSLAAQADSLNTALDELKRNSEKLRDEGVLNDDLSRKMDEIKKAVEELIKQYGDSLLFPKDNNSELSLSEMREAVEKLNQMLPELSERLDNTLKYLAMLKKDRELAMLALRAEKLAQEQAQLADKPAAKETPAQQKELLDRIDELAKEASSNLTTPDDAVLQQIDSSSASLKDELLQNSQPSPSRMRQLSGSLASLAQRLREKTEAYKTEQMEKLRQNLLDMAGNLVDLRAWQEQIASQKAATEEERRLQASNQQALNQALGFIENNLNDLPMLPPALKQQLSNRFKSADEASKSAVASLGSGSGSFPMKVTKKELDRTANTILKILELMESQSNSSCQNGGGMKESLRKMSGKQSAINAATASLLKQMLSERGQKPGPGSGRGKGEGGSEAARREAQRQQQELAEELKKLADKFGDSEGESMKKRIDELEKEAQKLATMLSSPREEVTERQDRFLARMLQSALSLHRENEGKEERKSTTAQNTFSVIPESANKASANQNDTFHKLRKQALQSGTYPPSYRAAINAYFDSLGVLYLR